MQQAGSSGNSHQRGRTGIPQCGDVQSKRSDVRLQNVVPEPNVASKKVQVALRWARRDQTGTSAQSAPAYRGLYCCEWIRSRTRPRRSSTRGFLLSEACTPRLIWAVSSSNEDVISEAPENSAKTLAASPDTASAEHVNALLRQEAVLSHVMALELVNAQRLAGTVRHNGIDCIVPFRTFCQRRTGGYYSEKDSKLQQGFRPHRWWHDAGPGPAKNSAWVLATDATGAVPTERRIKKMIIFFLL